MPFSRLGTLATSISMPAPPRLAISQVEQVRPAAPMSWMPTSSSPWINSSVASIKSFSMKGSATWTALRFSVDSSVISVEAKVAPWMPSRPVVAPM